MTQNSGPNDTKAAAKSVRSNDANHLDFTSLPMIGLIALARTAHEGASKYGRFNYMLGFSVHDLLNHVFRHLVLFNAGDRTDNHLEHAGWGILAAIQSLALDPEMSAPHLLGPGAILTEANLDHLASNADMLKEHRDSGKFASSSDWKTVDIPEVVRLLRQRHADPSIATTAVSHETVDAKPTAHTRTYGDGSVWDKLIDAKVREFCRPCEQHVNLDNYEYSKSPREYGDRSRILSAAERDKRERVQRQSAGDRIRRAADEALVKPNPAKPEPLDSYRPLTYIAGPMSGKPKHNFPAFQDAAEWLRREGYPVRSPHEGINCPPDELAPEDYALALRRSMSLLLLCNRIVMLPGWRESCGAKVELHMAAALNMPVMYLCGDGIHTEFWLSAHDLVSEAEEMLKMSDTR